MQERETRLPLKRRNWTSISFRNTFARFQMPVTLTSNVNNATYLITVHTARKHSPEFEKQAEDRTQEGSTPTREAIRETRLPRGLPLKTKHMVDGNDVIRPCTISFGGAKLVSMNTQSKNLDFAWIRNAFFVERNYLFQSNICNLFLPGT